MRCIDAHKDGEREATGYVRYVRRVNGAERIIGPYCDPCQVEHCVRLRTGYHGGVDEVGAVPLDYRERMNGARREGIKRRITDEIISHPGGPSEIADDLFHVMLHLGADYAVPALLDLVGARITQWQSERDEGAATMRAEIDPEGVF